MIKVKGNYYIDADTYCYMVRKFTGYDKENEPQYTTLTYHSSLNEALESILKRLERSLVSENDMTLSDALEKFKELKNEFIELLDIVRENESVKE